MKVTLFTTCLALLAYWAHAQQNFTVNATFPTISHGTKAYLVYIVSGRHRIDSAVVNNHTAYFKGSVPYVVNADVYAGSKGIDQKPFQAHATLVLQQGDITINGGDYTPYTMLGSGTPYNNSMVALYNAIRVQKHRADSVGKAAYAMYTAKVKDTAVMDLLFTEADSLERLVQLARRRYAEAHPNTYAALSIAGETMYTPSQKAFAAATYSKLSPALKATAEGVRINQVLASEKLTAVGAPAPDFTLPDVNGQSVRVSQFIKGKYVLIDFWASWCGPCRRENPNVLAAYNKYKDKNFTVLGVSLDRSKELWLKAIEADKLPWMQVSDLLHWQSVPAQLYGIQAIPANVLVNPQGIIIAKNLYGKELESALAQHIK